MMIVFVVGAMPRLGRKHRIGKSGLKKPSAQLSVKRILSHEDKRMATKWAYEQEIERLTARVAELEAFVLAEGECHISHKEVERLEAANTRYRDYLDGIAIGLETLGGWDASVEGIRKLLATAQQRLSPKEVK